MKRGILSLWAAVILLALTLGLVYLSSAVTPSNLVASLATLEKALPDWEPQGPPGTLDEETLEILKPSSYYTRKYRHQGGIVSDLFVAFFSLQKEGQMIHSPRHCVPGSGWTIRKRRRLTVPGPGKGWQVNQMEVVRGLDRLSFVYWYQGRGRVEPDEYLDRIRLVVDGILLQRSDGALVRISSALPRSGGEKVIEKQLKMAAALIPAMNRIMAPVH